ncbi:SixA phosphatase family protein [Microbulbifer epialgicus]|uniref:Histidine phosphatase family protein n=1 Tax=Microbulbifer epialgicus TaxID=393907 RepID=A0ABV4NZL6_9GAMM
MFSHSSARIAGFLIALLGISAWADSETTASESQVIYLVRHAEKQGGAGGGLDPQLSQEGQLRAKQLAHVLGQVGIEAVYSTDYARTKETATPLAEQLNLPVQTYNPHKLKEFAQQLHEASQRVLVVGHSNTTPKLVALLGGDQGKPIRESDEYDRLYILIRDRGEVTTLLQRYGADSRVKKAGDSGRGKAIHKN